jgi:pimeloyl-ACP methyl ester carboxylesterase
MSRPNPTILIVPGSFSPVTQYDSVVAHLRSANFPAFALQLPSTQKRMPLAPATMSDDASLIRRTVEVLLSQNKEVVVICHSYGGTPTTQALAGLKVRRLVYLSAIVPRMGQCNHEAMGGVKGEDWPLGMQDIVRFLLLFFSFHISTLISSRLFVVQEFQKGIHSMLQ